MCYVRVCVCVCVRKREREIVGKSKIVFGFVPKLNSSLIFLFLLFKNDDNNAGNVH